MDTYMLMMIKSIQLMHCMQICYAYIQNMNIPSVQCLKMEKELKPQKFNELLKGISFCLTQRKNNKKIGAIQKTFNPEKKYLRFRFVDEKFAFLFVKP